MGTDSDPESNGWSRARGVVLKTLVLIGGAALLRRLTKSTTRWDHTHIVSNSLSGEKYTREQASRDPDNFFNLRWLACPAAEMVDGSKVLYVEQAFWRTRHKPFRQRFFMVKPCPKEMKCDVELSTYAIRDAEEYKNFCDRSRDQRPQPEEVIGDIAEHLTTIHLKRCDRGKSCLYEGSTPPDGFPNPWNGAAYCTSELAVLKNNEIHTWDRGFDDEGNQVWGVKGGAYEFKPAPASSFVEMYSPLNFPPQSTTEKRIEGEALPPSRVMIQSASGAPTWTSALTQFSPASLENQPQKQSPELFDPCLLMPIPLAVEYPPLLLPATSLPELGGFSNKDLSVFESYPAEKKDSVEGSAMEGSASQGQLVQVSAALQEGSFMIGSIPVQPIPQESSSTAIEDAVVPSVSP